MKRTLSLALVLLFMLQLCGCAMFDRLNEEKKSKEKVNIPYDYINKYAGNSSIQIGAQANSSQNVIDEEGNHASEAQKKVEYYYERAKSYADYGDKETAVSIIEDALLEVDSEMLRAYLKRLEKEIEEEEKANAWREAYRNYLADIREDYSEFSLININDDDIPELYLAGECEAQGDMVCTYYDGRIVTCDLSRCGGGSYIPKSGLLKNTNGKSGYYYTEIWRLKNGKFSSIFNGHEEELYNEETEDVDVFYYIDDEETTESEYFSAIEKVFKTSKSKMFYDTGLTSYNGILTKITNW